MNEIRTGEGHERDPAQVGRREAGVLTRPAFERREIEPTVSYALGLSGRIKRLALQRRRQVSATRNIGLRRGVAPVRRYIPELLDDLLRSRIHPGCVFDFETDLDLIAEAYAAMDERRVIRSLVRVGTVRS